MKLQRYASGDLEHYIQYEKGEKKYGEYVQLTNEIPEDLTAELRKSDAEYVLFGIPEAIGIQLNPGKKATASAWEATLYALLNTQHNSFNKGNRLLLLGHLDVTAEMAIAHTLDLSSKKDLKKAGKLVEAIDKEVAFIISLIVASGKKPIVVGGGQNNAYGILKGCSLALNKPLNAVNLDTRSGFEERKKRHSENGFSYAFHEGFLRKYHIFGLHENYTSRALFKAFKTHEQDIQYITFEDIAIRQKRSFISYVNHALSYVNKSDFGIEIDCSTIAGVPAAVMNPGGFTVNQVRRFVTTMRDHRNVRYLHICEAAPDPADQKEMEYAGKFIAGLITDFMK